MSSLEDPNDPNVKARGQRLRSAYNQFMRAAQMHFRGNQAYLAQNQPLVTSVPMASEYVPQDSADIATVKYLRDYLIEQGMTPP